MDKKLKISFLSLGLLLALGFTEKANAVSKKQQVAACSGTGISKCFAGGKTYYVAKVILLPPTFPPLPPIEPPKWPY